jgi:hypothetical protein
LGPKSYTRPDDRIRDDVNDRLMDEPHLDASEIEVTVSNGEVTLSGHTRRREDKRLAEDLVDSVSGVRHLQNNLRVQGGDRDPESRVDTLGATSAGSGRSGSLGPAGDTMGRSRSRSRTDDEGWNGS